jgi:hypothetical protein
MKKAIVLGCATVGLLLAGFSGAAVAKDRNHDAIPDRWEKKFHLSVKVNQANKDQDRDKVDNRNEFREGTNPRDKDSDNDGVKDGREDRDRDGLNNRNEDASANDPVDQDTDDDGTDDGEEVVGTVASFDGTVLTIDLLNGGSVSGRVTASSEIKCENEDEQETENEDDDLASASSEDEGPGSDDSADDESGDDGGGDEGPGDNEGPGGDDARLCTTADLVPGTMVHEAELEGDTFEEIELVK